MCPIDKTKNRNHYVYCSDNWYHRYCSSYIGIYFNIGKINMTFKRISSLIFCQSVSFNHQETKLWWKCTTNPFSFSLLSAYYKLCLLLNSLLRRGKVDWLSSQNYQFNLLLFPFLFLEKSQSHVYCDIVYNSSFHYNPYLCILNYVCVWERRKKGKKKRAFNLLIVSFNLLMLTWIVDTSVLFILFF